MVTGPTKSAAATCAASNAVEHPRHYMGHTGIECMDAMRSMMGREAMASYWRGCVFKYLWRAPDKNGLEDLKKARQCLDYLIAEVEGGKGDGR